MTNDHLKDVAEQALALMRAQGFDAAQVNASLTQQDELNIADNEISLMRSTASQKVTLLGLKDGRKASTELSDFAPAVLAERIQSLFADALGAPQDAANVVSANQTAQITQGPQQADFDVLADKASELLAFRAAQAPLMVLSEGVVSHSLVQSHTLTSSGSDLASSAGWYGLSAFGTAREGSQSSSFNFAGGNTHDLQSSSAAEFFGIGQMMQDTTRQITTQPLSAKFQGEVILMPQAVQDLLTWLLGQISDLHLIAGSSLYRDKLGQSIASPCIDLRSRFAAPGCVALSADGFVAPPLQILKAGTLQSLTPSLYASRKTGLSHVPAAAEGWDLAAGKTPLNELISAVHHGAVVGRLSMGNPAPNGDFSGVIKNSFLIDKGLPGPALSEVMVTGNMARMLRNVLAASSDRIDTGSTVLPWLRIADLHFS